MKKIKCINHVWNITSKSHNNLLTRTSFFISNAGKIESVQEFKTKLFEQLFHCRLQPRKSCMAVCRSFY